MDQDATWYEASARAILCYMGIQLRPISGTARNFWPMSIVAKRSRSSATTEHLFCSVLHCVRKPQRLGLLYPFPFGAAGSPSHTVWPSWAEACTSVPSASWSVQPFGHNTPTLQTDGSPSGQWHEEVPPWFDAATTRRPSLAWRVCLSASTTNCVWWCADARTALLHSIWRYTGHQSLRPHHDSIFVRLPAINWQCRHIGGPHMAVGRLLPLVRRRGTHCQNVMIPLLVLLFLAVF